ncbi:hypothetical protein [Mechercharimyces sp. CAU 1602]|uniref:hypothetical protein n=1 Tax=Mechercharimyces sp. CAU 1602 TaxID=2973933 RepID=UPI002162ED04|nr:hypothetical protein [Mechercharimyces sp. CAU 1602]MCS1352476.1 hypothetical protein [Mechercharimyces sp. CAU 1602]
MQHTHYELEQLVKMKQAELKAEFSSAKKWRPSLFHRISGVLKQDQQSTTVYGLSWGPFILVKKQ